MKLHDFVDTNGLQRNRKLWFHFLFGQLEKSVYEKILLSSQF